MKEDATRATDDRARRGRAQSTHGSRRARSRKRSAAGSFARQASCETRDLSTTGRLALGGRLPISTAGDPAA